MGIMKCSEVEAVVALLYNGQPAALYSHTLYLTAAASFINQIPCHGWPHRRRPPPSPPHTHTRTHAHKTPKITNNSVVSTVAQ